MSGKTDKPRPFSVDADTFAGNFERTFGNKNTSRKIELEYGKEEYINSLASGMFWEKWPELTGSWQLDKERWLEIIGQNSK